MGQGADHGANAPWHGCPERRVNGCSFAGREAIGKRDFAGDGTACGRKSESRADHPRSRMMRAWSRFQSRSLMLARLSCVCLPLASASSTLARPRELK